MTTKREEEEKEETTPRSFSGGSSSSSSSEKEVRDFTCFLFSLSLSWCYFFSFGKTVRNFFFSDAPGFLPLFGSFFLSLSFETRVSRFSLFLSLSVCVYIFAAGSTAGSV